MMRSLETPRSPHFFLGANTARGFYSLYSELADPEAGDRVWYIKGGPGNGKSTFMRRVADAAAAAGRTVERFPCSGDPDSLDAVYIREEQTAYVDATSPHVQEPSLPGAGGRYLDLSVFYKPGLEKERQSIRRCFRQYREQYARCYDLLRAAELCAPDRIPGLTDETVRSGIRRRAASLAAAEVQRETAFSERRRFLSALTCRGWVFFRETIPDGWKVFVLESRVSLADVFLQELVSRCRELECRILACPDPVTPERLQAVLIPGQETAFVASDPELPPLSREFSRLHLDAMTDVHALRGDAEAMQRAAGLRAQLFSEARSSLSEAKRIHDELEGLYRPWLDTDGLDALCEKHLEKNM